MMTPNGGTPSPSPAPPNGIWPNWNLSSHSATIGTRPAIQRSRRPLSAFYRPGGQAKKPSSSVISLRPAVLSAAQFPVFCMMRSSGLEGKNYAVHQGKPPCFSAEWANASLISILRFVRLAMRKSPLC